MEYGCESNPGVFDAGGKIEYVRSNPRYPGIERVLVAPYAYDGRDVTYYRLAAEGESGREFATLREARQAQAKELAARRDARGTVKTNPEDDR